MGKIILVVIVAFIAYSMFFADEPTEAERIEAEKVINNVTEFATSKVNNLIDGKEYIDIVKSQKLKEYPSNNIGNSIKNFMDEEKWSYLGEKDGVKLVRVEGYVYVGTAFSDEEWELVEYIFSVNEQDKSAKLIEVYYNGEMQPQEDIDTMF